MKNKLSLILAGLLLSTTTLAQAAWPERPISLIVPFPPGGATDIIGRLVSKELSDRLGVSVVVENRSGAAGNIGSRYVAQSKPDGYTLLVATTAQTIGTALYKNLGYDLLGDLDSVSTINDGPLILMSNLGLGVSNINELIEAAKNKPQGLTYATPGYGSSAHMAAEVFGLVTGANLVHVPYQGAAPAMNDLISGQVDIAFDLILSARQFVEDKRVQRIGIATRERSPLAPDWPTLAEQHDELAGFNETAWNVLMVPKDTPADIVQTLNGHLKEILESEHVKEKFAELGNLAIWNTVEDTREFIVQDVEKWKAVIRDANIEQL